MVAANNDGEQLLIANEYADNAVLLDAASGRVVHAFDLSESKTSSSGLSYRRHASTDGRRGFVALWNSSAVVELDLEKGRSCTLQLATAALARPQRVRIHPHLRLVPDQKTLYVALSNRDRSPPSM